MILNSYAILTAFVSLLRLVLGVAVLGVGASAWRARGQGVTPEGRSVLEDRCYLLFMLALLLLGLNLVSWPLLYLLLQSYVREWPGVMCIYGVTQIGTGSLGPSRFLPDLLLALQCAKPLLVFAGGSWFVIYLVNRRTRTAPLLGRLLLGLLPLGALATADVAAELAYVVIPKKEVFPSSGCCTGTLGEDGTRFLPQSLVGESGQRWLYSTYYGVNFGIILALVAFTRRRHSLPTPSSLALLMVGGMIVLAISGLFLVEFAAPTLLQLPYHYCPYDFIPRVPEAVVAVALFMAGSLFLGWACVARWLGRCPETEIFLPVVVRNLLRLSLWGYLASLAMLSLELLLA